MTTQGRPALAIGRWGSINTERRDKGGKVRWRSRVRVRDLDGVTRQIEAVAESKGKAEAALNLKIQERFRGAVASVKDDTLVMDLAELWLSQLEDKGKSARTIQDYNGAVRRYVEPNFAQVKVGECSVLLVESMLHKVHKKHGAGAAKTFRAVLMQILQIAVRHHGLAANPVRDAEMLKGQPVRQPRALTRDEERRLRDTLTDHEWDQHYDLRDPILFALATGVRLGELCAIRWVDLEMIGGTVSIEGTVQRITGQGIVRKPSTKTRAGMRVLKLPDWAVRLVEERRRRYVERFGREPEMADPLFTSPTGGVMDPSNTQRLLRRLFRKAGLTGVTSHTFRKTVATRLDEAGLTAREIADQLGHNQVTETLNRYMGRSTASVKAANIL